MTHTLHHETLNKIQYRKYFILGLIVSIVFGFLFGNMEEGIFQGIFQIVSLIYLYSISVKRFKDIGDHSPRKSALFTLIPIVGFFVIIDLFTKESNSIKD